MKVMTKHDQFKSLGSVDTSALESKKIKHDLRQLKRAERRLFQSSNKSNKEERKENEEIVLTDHKQYLKLLASGLTENHHFEPSTISVFIGSPTPDFNEERNVLFHLAHTNLKDFCKQNCLELNWVDLRWGMNECETPSLDFTNLSKWCIQLCSRESLGPCSIQLLGTRYGVQPVPQTIESKEFQVILNLARKNFKPLARMLLEWYREDNNSLNPGYQLQTSRLVLEEAKPSDLDPTLKELEEGGAGVTKSSIIVPERRVDLTKIEVPSDWMDVEPYLKDLLVRAVDYCCDLSQLVPSRLRHYKLSSVELEVRENIIQREGSPLNSKSFYSRTIENFQLDCIDKAETYFDLLKSDGRPTVLNQENREMIKELCNRGSRAIKKSNGIEANFSVDFSDIIKEVFPTEYLRDFSARVMNDLQSQISAHINHIQKKQEITFIKEASKLNHRVSHLATEIQHHCYLRERIAENFCDSSNAVDWIKHWLLDQSNVSLAFIFGASALGKSSLVARAEQLANKWYAKTPVVKVVRFIGSSCDSLTLEHLLVSVIRQLGMAYDFVINESRMNVLQTVVLYFHDILHHISINYGKQRPLFMFLDGLDYLVVDDCSKSIHWLPSVLPYYVKLLVTSSVLLDTTNGLSVDTFNMEALQEQSCRQMVTALLYKEGRKITDSQLDTAVTKILQTGSPLHAKFIVREASNWSSYECPLTSFDSSSIEDVVNIYFDNLEVSHGQVLVSYALGYLTVSHVGLSFSEMEDLLSCNDEVLSEVFANLNPPPNAVVRLPPFVLMSLRQDLEHLLRPCLIKGVSPFYWSNLVVAKIAFSRYACGERYFQLHHQMSEFYICTESVRQTISINTKKDQFCSVDADRMIAHTTFEMKHQLPRKLRSIVHHLTHGQQLLEFKQLVICDFGILNTWISLFKPRRTIAMLNAAMKLLETSTDNKFDVEIKAVHDCLEQNRSLLERDPSQLPEQLLGRLVSFRDEDGGVLGSICANIGKLCEDCKNYLSEAVSHPESYRLKAVFPCLPSNFGALKWYHDTVKSVYQLSRCQNYLLLLLYNAARMPCLSIMDTRIVLCNWTVQVVEEPLDAQINHSVTLVFALFRKEISVYNLGDGEHVCTLSNIVSGCPNPINSCMAVSQTNKAIATAFEDKIAVYFNRSMENYRTSRFEFEKLLTVKLSHRSLAATSINTEKVCLLVTAHITKNEGLIMMRAANFDTHESLSSICLPPLRDLYHLIAQPLLSRHMVPVGQTGKIVIFLADGQVFLVDLFAPAILWQYQERINPNYLKIETPRLRYHLFDERSSSIFFIIRYGPDSFLRIYDISSSELTFLLTSSEPHEQISSACYKYEIGGEIPTGIVIGGNRGSCVHMDLKFAQKQLPSTIFKEHKLKTAFKAYYSPVRFLFYKDEHLFSVDNRKLLKSWRFCEISGRYFSKLTTELMSTHLHNEPIRYMCITSDKRYVVTSSERVLKMWQIDDGSWIRTLRLKWVNPDDLGEFIEDCSKFGLVMDDSFIISESKINQILFVAKFTEGLALSRVKLPLAWCSSHAHYQGAPLVAAIYTKDNCKFTFKLLSVPTLECQLVKYFYSPHPGIEETVRDLCFTENQNFILLKWSQKASETFEGLLFNISYNENDNIPEAEDNQDDSDDLDDEEAPPSTNTLNAKSGLVACAQSSQKSQTGANSAAKLFWKITALLPATHMDKVFVGAASGQIPVWHLNGGDCQLPYLPCMEAWMKHSVTMAFVKTGARPPARRTYDELSVKKSAISALACGVIVDANTGMPNLIASGAKDGSIIIWHARKAALERDYDLMKSWSYRTLVRNAHSVQITCLHFMLEDSILLSSSYDRNICIISTKNGEIINSLFTSTPVMEFFSINNPDYVAAKCANESEQRVFIFQLYHHRLLHKDFLSEPLTCQSKSFLSEDVE